MLFTMRETLSKSHIVLGIVPVAIIDHQLPFEYTITSRSTDVVVMALPVQNINHSAFRSMFEREKLPGNNFIDWFCQLKLVLRVEKKMYFIEQPLPAVPIADSEAQDLIVGLILNGLTKDFAGFVRNYNCIILGARRLVKTMLSSVSLFSYPKNPKPSAKEHPTKDDTCHHCKEVGHWKRNCPVYLAELLKKKKQVGSASSSDFGISVSKNNVFYFNVIPSNGIYEIDMHDLVPNVNSIYNVSTKRAKHNLDSTYLWHCRLAHISMMTRKSFPHHPERVADLLGIIHTGVCGPLRHVSRQVENQLGKTIKAHRSDRGGKYISQEFKDYLKACRIVQQLTPPYTSQHNDVSERRNRTLLDMVRSMMNLTTLPLSFWDYALES
ncbi:retrotransposon protein, putative, ty1-copia subclass, partial [Tanacetum coccineum]